MKNTLKRSLSFLLAITLVFGSVYVGLGEVDFGKIDLGGLFAVKVNAASVSDLSFTLNDDGKSYSITGCKSSASGSLTIPSTYNGKTVTGIGYEAFDNCTKLTAIIMPDSVTSIGDYAFRDCKNLTSLTIPDGVESIGDNAFMHCIKLTDITIPDRVTSIGFYAFYGCTRLKSITIGNGVTSIGSSAFCNCTSLTSIIIPDSVTSIENSAFCNCTGLVSVTIGKGVISIGSSAFEGCTRLKSITIPDSVTRIDSNAFDNTGYYNNSSNWKNDVLYIGNHLIKAKASITGVYEIENGTKCIGNYAFDNCTKLTEIIIPDSVTIIGENAFSACKSLATVTIGNSVTSIGTFAFYDCKSLISITIPDSVTSIGNAAFVNTGYYNNSSNWKNDVLYIGNHLIKAKTSITGAYEIKNGTKCIGSYAFFDCESLTSITIPSSVTSIGIYAFYNCTGLTVITIPNSVISIGAGAFECCTNLESVIIPESVTNIGNYVFAYCESLESITIPDSVTKIGCNAFEECKKLTTVNLGKGLTCIDDQTFNYCRALKEIVFTGNVKHIGNEAFGSCVSLESITIPDGVKSIGYSAFYFCTRLKSITIPDSVTSIGNAAFKDCRNLTSIIVTSANKYYSSADGVLFNKDKTALICYPLGKTNSSYTIPDSVKKISNVAFAWCKKLTGVIIPSSVISIEDNSFSNTNLRYVFFTGSKKQWNAIGVEIYNPAIHYNSTTHTYEPKTTKATVTKNGKVETKCIYCTKITKSTVIYYPKTIELSSSTVTYNGKVRTPSVIVKDSKGKTLVKGTDYKVTVPSGRKLPGIYKYTITFIGKYSGTKTLTLKILPATVSSKMTAVPTSSSIKLTWPKVAGVTGYKVYQYSPSQGKYVQIATVTGNTYKKTGLKAGTTYNFKVKAYKKLSNGTVIEGALSNAFATATKCAAPTISSLVASNGQKATIKWSSVTGATGYQVYYSTKKDSGYQKAVSTTSKSASKTFSKSAKGKKIYFKVRAYKKVNGQTIYGNWSAVKSTTIK